MPPDLDQCNPALDQCNPALECVANDSDGLVIMSTYCYIVIGLVKHS